MNKEFRNATLKELESWPGVTLTEDEGGKHGKMTLHFGGESKMIVVANTPSDARALPNHIALVRREIRAMGAERAHVIVGKPKAPPANPVLREVPKFMEKPMSNKSRQTTIFNEIGELRYAEMLELAGTLRDLATDQNLRRGDVNSWARLLQTAVEFHAAPKALRDEALAA